MPTFDKDLPAAIAQIEAYQSYQRLADAGFKHLARAFRIATFASQEIVESEGAPTGAMPGEFRFAQSQVDGHVRECIEHLCASGLACSDETSDGYIIVRLNT